MKKFYKIILILSLLLFVAGLILSTAGRVLGGRRQLRDLVSHEFMTISEDAGWYYGQDEMDFRDNYTTWTGDFNQEIHELTACRVTELDVETAGENFCIWESPDSKARLEGIDVSRVQFYVENQTLYIRAWDKRNTRNEWNEKGEITLYLPKDYSFIEAELKFGPGSHTVDFLNAEELSVELGAGEAFLSGVNAGYAEIDVGMGDLTVFDSSIRDMDFEIGMGNLNYEGSITGNLSGECDMGNAELALEGTMKEHNYRMQAELGSIGIDGRNNVGVTNWKLDNGVESNFNLSCAMGNIEIYFTNTD